MHRERSLNVLQANVQTSGGQIPNVQTSLADHSPTTQHPTVEEIWILSPHHTGVDSLKDARIPGALKLGHCVKAFSWQIL